MAAEILDKPHLNGEKTAARNRPRRASLQPRAENRRVGAVLGNEYSWKLNGFQGIVKSVEALDWRPPTLRAITDCGFD